MELDPNKWILKSVQYDPTISVGTNDILQSAFAIYPNPSHQGIHIQSVEHVDIQSVQIYDLKGTLAVKMDMVGKNVDAYYMNLNAFEAGVYIIQL